MYRHQSCCNRFAVSFEVDLDGHDIVEQRRIPDKRAVLPYVGFQIPGISFYASLRQG